MCENLTHVCHNLISQLDTCVKIEKIQMCELFPTRQEQINCVSLSCDSQVRSSPIQWMAGWMKKQTSLDQHQQTSPVKIRKLDLLLGSTASLEGCVKAKITAPIPRRGNATKQGQFDHGCALDGTDSSPWKWACLRAWLPGLSPRTD